MPACACVLGVMRGERARSMLGCHTCLNHECALMREPCPHCYDTGSYCLAPAPTFGRLPSTVARVPAVTEGGLRPVLLSAVSAPVRPSCCHFDVSLSVPRPAHCSLCSSSSFYRLQILTFVALHDAQRPLGLGMVSRESSLNTPL